MKQWAGGGSARLRALKSYGGRRLDGRRGWPRFQRQPDVWLREGRHLGSDGKRHVAYVPLSSLGFEDLLPFYRRAEEIGKFGNEPLNISVDKVQALQVNELYLEHMVVKGRRLHILAVRVAEGPVELFSYTQTKRVEIWGTLAQTTYLVYPRRHWYLRRPGEKLVEVSRRDFVAQLAQYFQDEPTVVAALTSQQVRYRDLLAVVMTYNQLRSQHHAAQP